MINEHRVVISPYAGGLGDNLCFSTLPEMYARKGYEVYVGRPAVEPQVRNEEVKNLVWRLNPFVAGFVDEVGRTFTHREMHRWIWQQNETRTLVEAMEALHGFEPTHKLPKIYYQPKWRRDVGTAIFADPTSISQPISAEVFEEFVNHVCRARDHNPRDIVVLTSKNSGQNGRISLPNSHRYEVSDIFEYADLIWSCKLFFSAESGGAILASALRRDSPTPELFSLFTTHGTNDRLFQFPNVRYCTTGNMNSDFLEHSSAASA